MVRELFRSSVVTVNPLSNKGAVESSGWLAVMGLSSVGSSLL